MSTAVRRKRKGVKNGRRGPRVIVYIRVSAVMGREDMKSPEVQAMECMALAEREGLTIVDTVIEIDKTGTSFDAREISKIIDRVEANEADGIIVWKISRWGRNTMDSLLNIGVLEKVGGYLLSATENLDNIETPAGRFSLIVLLGIAEMFSKEMASTWASVHNYRRRTMMTTHSGTPRLGYLRVKDIPEEERMHYRIPTIGSGKDMVTSEYVVDPVKGPWVKKAYEDYVGGKSLIAICNELDEAGIRSTRGNRITEKSLRATLDSGFGAGFIVDRRDEVDRWDPGVHEPLITAEMWKKYQRRRYKPAAPRTKSAPYRLAGLLRCTGCGKAMHACSRKNKRTGEKARYFRCGHLSKKFTDDCPNPVSIDESRVEDIVLKWLTERADGQQKLDEVIERANKVESAKKSIDRIAKEITKAERRLSVLTDKHLDDKISDSAYKIKEAEILEEIARLKVLSEQAQVDVEINDMPSHTVFGGAVAMWDLLDPAMVNEAIKHCIKRIEVTKADHAYGRGRVHVVGAWEPDLKVVQSRAS